VDDIVGEIEFNVVEREVGVWDLLGEDHVSVTVVTGERGGSVGMDADTTVRLR